IENNNEQTTDENSTLEDYLNAGLTHEEIFNVLSEAIGTEKDIKPGSASYSNLQEIIENYNRNNSKSEKFEDLPLEEKNKILMSYFSYDNAGNRILNAYRENKVQETEEQEQPIQEQEKQEEEKQKGKEINKDDLKKYIEQVKSKKTAPKRGLFKVLLGILFGITGVGLIVASIAAAPLLAVAAAGAAYASYKFTVKGAKEMDKFAEFEKEVIKEAKELQEKNNSKEETLEFDKQEEAAPKQENEVSQQEEQQEEQTEQTDEQFDYDAKIENTLKLINALEEIANTSAEDEIKNEAITSRSILQKYLSDLETNKYDHNQEVFEGLLLVKEELLQRHKNILQKAHNLIKEKEKTIDTDNLEF
ncbi:MAG: hypothetical protein J5779_00935, partial [Clostridia bacterium]|nr:hypothetical protein [Clostridia bacterium]